MRRTLALAFAIILALPMAAANWTYRGNNEPDTALDTPTFMFYEPDTDSNQNVHKIYFNGFAKSPSEGEYNANVGILGSRLMPPETNIAAILGFWKDCNDDGYIGLIETAALEYRAELLLDTTICPPSTPVNGQAVYPHNDGTWIRELIWIGPNKDAVGAPSQNPTNFYADGTGVWGDWGKPGAVPVLVCPGTGNFGIRSTGALLEYIDCQTYFRTVRTLNDVQDATGLPTGGWEMHDIDNSPSPLNIDNPVYPYLYGPEEPEGHPNEGDYRGFNGGIFGRDNGNEQKTRMVEVVDCDADGPKVPPTVNLPTDVNDPSTYPSLYESLNDTYEVATQGGDNPCDPSGSSDQGFPYPSPEGYVEPTFAEAGRREVDHTFEFSPGSRNGFPLAPLAGTCRGPTSRDPNSIYNPGLLGYCPPGDLGLNVYRHDGPIGPAWRTNSLIGLQQMALREGLKNDEPDFGGWYASFYAKIGSAALAVGQTPGGSGVYGAEACQGATSGIHNGWNCDEDAWIARCADPELAVLPELCYRVGFTYHLRDVDCWDGTVARGTGIRASLADLSNSGPCEYNPANEQIDLPDLD